MNTYVVGDVQGCADELERLLASVRFDPGQDRLWLLGDLINRGPKSLQTLRLARSLGQACTTILGNHDLSILAQSYDGRTPSRVKKTAREIAAAPDGHELLDWLRHRPLAHRCERYLLIHAGLPPQWSVEQALGFADEVERALRGPDHVAFMDAMFGDRPDRWDASLEGIQRLRFITNCLTRLRFCTADGRLALAEKQSARQASKGLLPWFAVPGRASTDTTILFGHWSTLGQVYWPQYRVWGLDTGCVWGGRLTALHLESLRLIQAPSRGHKKPGAS